VPRGRAGRDQMNRMMGWVEERSECLWIFGECNYYYYYTMINILMTSCSRARLVCTYLNRFLRSAEYLSMVQICIKTQSRIWRLGHPDLELEEQVQTVSFLIHLSSQLHREKQILFWRCAFIHSWLASTLMRAHLAKS
jgi:hypothetical protein